MGYTEGTGRGQVRHGWERTGASWMGEDRCVMDGRGRVRHGANEGGTWASDGMPREDEGAMQESVNGGRAG